MAFNGSESSATSWKVDGVEMLTKFGTVFNMNPILLPGARRSPAEEIPFSDRQATAAEFWAPQGRTLVLEVDSCDADGDLVSDPIAQLLINIRWYRARLLDRVTTGDGTRLWEVTWRDGVTETGRARVTNTNESDNVDGHYCTIDIDVTLPDGPLEPAP